VPSSFPSHVQSFMFLILFSTRGKKIKKVVYLHYLFRFVVIYTFTQICRDKSNRGCVFKTRLGHTLQSNKGDLHGFTFSTQVGYPDYPYGSEA
jgi:hypothetical protein